MERPGPSAAVKLPPYYAEKPWGRLDLPPQFIAGAAGRRIGEVWFPAPPGQAMPLLVKYLFTSEPLSVQVHPDDAQARARGFASGKSECWYVLDAEPGARLALGPRAELDAPALHQAALDGSIAGLLDWLPVVAGDVFMVPGGTVHAIGAGLSLVEVQQNIDLTYRLYDYGRARELHIDDAVAVSHPVPYRRAPSSGRGPGSRVLVQDSHFVLCLVDEYGALPAALAGSQWWVTPLQGAVRSGSERAVTGECLWLPAGAPLQFEPGARALVAASP